MAIIGGGIREASFNHPTVGSGTLYAKSGESNTFDNGGLRSEDDANGVDGGGNMIAILNMQRWACEFVPAWDMSSGTLESLSDMAGDPADADWTVTHNNGSVWQGKGRPVGDIVGDGSAATIALKISGGGKMKKIS